MNREATDLALAKLVWAGKFAELLLKYRHGKLSMKDFLDRLRKLEEEKPKNG